MALVGPTGAGKTTTLAKLANHPAAFGGQRIGLVCLDTYRVGAVEQARIYAELSHMAFEVVYRADEVGKAMKRLADRDIILVDTAGRGPRQSADAAMTLDCLTALRPVETHLVMPAGVEPGLAQRWLMEFRRHPLTHLLITKLDEFPEPGVLPALARLAQLPMRWCADGQEVPGDLHPAANWPVNRIFGQDPLTAEAV
jgi:flagellar biosynthesis protein FlhF